MAGVVIIGVMLGTTLEGQNSSFGNPAKAEFYPVQLNPESSAGVFVPKAGTTEVVYVKPSRLLGASDIASVIVAPSSPGSSLSSVSVILTSTAVARIHSFISGNSPDTPVALIWHGQVLYRYPASDLATSGQILIAGQLDPTDASQLVVALH
jgi:hypothetical protein